MAGRGSSNAYATVYLGAGSYACVVITFVFFYCVIQKKRYNIGAGEHRHADVHVIVIYVPSHSKK